MKKDFGSDKLSAINAKFEAQKIAFGPIMFQAARLLRETGLLQKLKEAKDTGCSPEDAAADVKLSVYAVRVLLDAGLSMGMVKLKNERYHLTKTGFFILADDLTRTNFDFVHNVCYKSFYHLEASVKTGEPAGLKEFGDWKTIYPYLMALPEKARTSWFNFDHFYSDVSFPEVLPIIFKEKVNRLLDIGGNTGKFAFQCAGYSKNVEVTIMDLPGQLKKAVENIKSKGLEKRIHTYALNLLDNSLPFPKGFDAIWMSQLLDCFSEDQILSILKRCHDAMEDQAFMYILELFWDRQQYEASSYCLNATSLYFTCLANGNSRMYHSEDLIKLIGQAGFEITEEYNNLGISHTLLKCRKRK
jgi:ubiquinone/menaquinone biosynthesis C-methylase UbiE